MVFPTNNTISQSMSKDNFHGLLDKLDSLKYDILAAYEHKMENLRAENLQLRSRLADASQPHFRQQHVGEVLPGCISPESDCSDGGGRRMWDLEVVPSGAQETAPKNRFMKLKSKSSLGGVLGFIGGANPNSHQWDVREHTDDEEEPKAAHYDSETSEIKPSSSIVKFSETEETYIKEMNGTLSKKKKKLSREYDSIVNKAGVRGMMVQRTSIINMAHEKRFGDTRRHVLTLISCSAFDATIGAIITANAVTIGIETSYGVKGQNPPMSIYILETIFLCVYITELALRLYAVGLHRSFRSPWIKFDAFLVGSGVIDFVIKAILAGNSAEVLDKIMLVRMLRLTRLARTVRLMIQFRTLWLLVQGLMHSLLTLLWTLVVILLFCYCFSIIGLELIRSSPEYGPEYEETVDLYFGSLGDAMITHLQFLTLDDVGVVFRPLIKARPELAVYFISFIMLVSIALMNLVTAIMVESSLRQAKEDQEAHKAWESQKKKALMPKLRIMFREMDEDGSGELDLTELRGASEEIKSQLQRICNMEDVEEIFKSLDYDESGAVDIDEFCEGMLKATQDRPGELVRILKQCTEILKNTRETTAMLNRAASAMSMSTAASPSSGALSCVSLESDKTHKTQ